MYCREQHRSRKFNPHTLQQERRTHPGQEFSVKTSVAVAAMPGVWPQTATNCNPVLYDLTCGVFRLGCRNCSMGFHQLQECVISPIP